MANLVSVLGLPAFREIVVVSYAPHEAAHLLALCAVLAGADVASEMRGLARAVSPLVPMNIDDIRTASTTDLEIVARCANIVPVKDRYAFELRQPVRDALRGKPASAPIALWLHVARARLATAALVERRRRHRGDADGDDDDDNVAFARELLRVDRAQRAQAVLRVRATGLPRDSDATPFAVFGTVAVCDQLTSRRNAHVPGWDAAVLAVSRGQRESALGDALAARGLSTRFDSPRTNRVAHRFVQFLRMVGYDMDHLDRIVDTETALDYVRRLPMFDTDADADAADVDEDSTLRKFVAHHETLERALAHAPPRTHAAISRIYGTFKNLESL